jgi:putative thioredoxin
MATGYIIDVNEADFEYEVVDYSKNHPVVVDFWAGWCQPCKQLTPLLEKLANEASGEYRLARVDTDSNPNLAMKYGVRSLPTVKVFTQGQVSMEFVGMQPEARLREFLSNITPPSPLSLALEKANSLLDAHEWAEAEAMFKDVRNQDPDSAAALLGLAMAALGQGTGGLGLMILKKFPASREYARAQLVLPYAEYLVEFLHNRLPDETELDAAFINSIRLASRGNLPAAIDGLLEIMRRDRHYRQDRARLVVLGLLELLGPIDPQTRQYRSELAAVLF